MKVSKTTRVKHRIFFALNYFYLNYPTFQPVMEKLEEKGVDTILLDLPGNNRLVADQVSGHLTTSCYQELPLKLEPRYKGSLFYKAMLLFKTLYNFRLIRIFIKKERPSAIVVGSDIGNVHIRFLMDACFAYNVPVIILYNCDVPVISDPALSSQFNVLSQKFISFIGCFSFIRAIIFKGHIPGEYHREATIYVISEDIRVKLTKSGIRPGRIKVTGMPQQCVSKKDKRTVFRELAVPENSRVIAHFPGPMGAVFGRTCEIEIMDTLRRIVDKLPQDMYFAVKVHPRETSNGEAIMRRIFDSARYRIVKSVSAEELIPHVDLAIGYFSRVLIMAAILGKRFMSMNIVKNDERSFLIGFERELLELRTDANIEEKIRLALYDTSFGKKLDEAVASVAKRFTAYDKTGPIESITSCILGELRE